MKGSALALRIVAAVLVFLLTLVIMPYYTDGDQYHYRKAYEGLRDLGITDGFLFYARSTGSKEFTHFILSWVASRFIEKDLFIAFSNAALAYVTLTLFQKWKVSAIISFALLLTNYYFFVLYLAAERLKFGFIFLALSMIYFENVKRVFGFAFLALISHAQIIIVYLSMLFNLFVKQLIKICRTAKVSKSYLILIPFLAIPPLVLGSHLTAKFSSYYSDRSLAELIKCLVFLLLALWYSKHKMETLMVFIPIFVIAYLVGGDRVNVMGYFVFLYYGVQCRRGWNLGVLATSAYFSYASIDFLTRVFEYGEGFFAG